MCTEAGMYALRERRVHVTQEDFEMAVAKVCIPLLLNSLKRFPTVRPNPAGKMINVAFKLPFKTLTCSRHQVMQKDSEKNMSIKKLWK